MVLGIAVLVPPTIAYLSSADNRAAVAETISGLKNALLHKGEYVPPGLSGELRNKYRDAVHRYKEGYGYKGDLPKEILDQIADAVKNGVDPAEIEGHVDEPPEGG